MRELTKFLRFFLVSSILLITISCDKDIVIGNIEITTPLTKEDSIIQLARDLNIDFDVTKENINNILDKILESKKSLILRLDSLDRKTYEIENLAYEYKKKENKKIREQLLSEIEKIKKELERIKKIAGDDIIKKDSTSIPEIKIPEISTFENLPAGNYVSRLDKYYLISIYIRENGEIIIGQPRLDSTTVLKGSKNISPRLKKELEAIKKKLINNNN